MHKAQRIFGAGTLTYLKLAWICPKTQDVQAQGNKCDMKCRPKAIMTCHCGFIDG